MQGLHSPKLSMKSKKVSSAFSIDMTISNSCATYIMQVTIISVHGTCNSIVTNYYRWSGSVVNNMVRVCVCGGGLAY